MNAKIKYYFSFILLCTSVNSSADCVILLHGLTRSADSMQKIDKALSDLAYQTININYPSTQFDIPTLAVNAIEPALTKCLPQNKVHFVTHSLGGILVRYYFNQYKAHNLGRVVMIGPPNQGSEVVDKLKNIPGFYLINGPAGLQLGTDQESMPNKLGKANFELGIIAGSRSINLLLSSLIPGEDDGKVSIERSKLDGMSDHIILPVTHPFMMKDKEVIAQVIFFLKNGYFQREEK
ncbi:MAG: esterase/lipase family protein [Cellvibrionaceae bacterium]